MENKELNKEKKELEKQYEEANEQVKTILPKYEDLNYNLNETV